MLDFRVLLVALVRRVDKAHKAFRELQDTKVFKAFRELLEQQALLVLKAFRELLEPQV